MFIVAIPRLYDLGIVSYREVPLPARQVAVPQDCRTATVGHTRVAARWRCSARCTVDRPTPNRSASQHVEQQPADRIVGVVHRGAEAELDLPDGQLVGNSPRVGQRTGQPVEFGDHQGVSFPAGGHRFPQSRPFPVGAGQPVINIDTGGGDAQPSQCVTLGREVLLVGGTAGVPDEKRRHGAPPEYWPGRRGAATRGNDGSRYLQHTPLTSRTSTSPESTPTHRCQQTARSDCCRCADESRLRPVSRPRTGSLCRSAGTSRI